MSFTIPRFSLIIPAHNEEQRIGRTLELYAPVFADSEILVVLNGCTDATRGVVEIAKTKFGNIRFLDIPAAIGKGGAVRCGFLIARAAAVGFADADGATPPEEMRRLFERLGENDGLIASRWLPDSDVAVRQPFSRRVASRCFNFLVRVLFGLPFADTQCGAKVFKAAALRHVMRDVETSNLAFDVELLHAMYRRKMKLAEIPTVWRDADGSRVRVFSASFKMAASLARLRLRYSFLRVVIPAFDRLVPTKPVRFHDGLRVLILNWRDPKHPRAGGAEVYLHEMARRWVRQGHTVEWLTSAFEGASRSETIDGVKITRVGNAASVYVRVPLAYLRSFRDRFDVILDSENGIPFFSPFFSLKPKVCLVYHVHREVFRKHLPWPISEAFVWAESWLMPRVYKNSMFVTISHDTQREMIESRFSTKPIGVVHCGVDANLSPGAKAERPTISYLGRLMPYKRVDHLIDAFERVRAEVPEALLVIAGVGEAEASLKALVKDRKLEDAVVFEGFVSEDRKREILRESWVFCSPSEMEGWGISVIEANACGTPAVTYAVPGLREAVNDGASGILVDEGGDLSEPILRILTDTALRDRLSAGAVRRAAELSWDSAANEMLEHLLHAVIGDWFGLVQFDRRTTLIRRSDDVARRVERSLLHEHDVLTDQPLVDVAL